MGFRREKSLVDSVSGREIHPFRCRFVCLRKRVLPFLDSTPFWLLLRGPERKLPFFFLGGGGTKSRHTLSKVFDKVFGRRGAFPH